MFAKRVEMIHSIPVCSLFCNVGLLLLPSRGGVIYFSMPWLHFYHLNIGLIYDFHWLVEYDREVCENCRPRPYEILQFLFSSSLNVILRPPLEDTSSRMLKDERSCIAKNKLAPEPSWNYGQKQRNHLRTAGCTDISADCNCMKKPKWYQKN